MNGVYQSGVRKITVAVNRSIIHREGNNGDVATTNKIFRGRGGL